MKTHTARKLIRLNAKFYQTFAAEFVESRHVLGRGLRRALAALTPARSILDVGCGDGRAAQGLADLGWKGEYTGVDASQALLAQARARNLGAVRANFVQADLAAPGWAAGLPRRRYEAAALFAVLHHIPGTRRRARLLRQAASLLGAGGRVALSAWQFLDDERLRHKIVSWAEAGIDKADVGAEDYLIDWKRGGTGLRYVAALDEAALGRLADAAGLSVEEMYRADGRTGGLSLFVVLSQRQRWRG